MVIAFRSFYVICFFVDIFFNILLWIYFYLVLFILEEIYNDVFGRKKKGQNEGEHGNRMEQQIWVCLVIGTYEIGWKKNVVCPAFFYFLWKWYVLLEFNSKQKNDKKWQKCITTLGIINFTLIVCLLLTKLFF